MHTPRGLIHMNVAPQGWTNTVAMVQRNMIRVMQTVSPHITQPYIDDLAVKGPRKREDDEVLPRVRRFVWRHIQDLDKVLGLLEEYNLMASGPKSKHCMKETTILGFVCNENGRRPDVKKTDKIVEWPVPFRSVTDVRSFLGTCGFWRSFVKNFAAKTEQLRKLVQQDQEWTWDEDQEEAVANMREKFRKGGLVLGAPDYDATETRPFIVETDAGPTALGGVLIQADIKGKERPLRFESRTLPIRLEIVNADDFIPTFDQFMQDQAILQSEWMTTLPLWTRKAERPLARQIRDMARDWDGCRAHLRAAFRQTEPPRPRVERRLRSCRQREPEPAEDRISRRGRKALARREEETVPEAEERGEGPECELGPVEFHRYTGGGPGEAPQHIQEEIPVVEGSLQELEAHLDAAQWREPLMSERRIEAVAEVPQEDVLDPEQEEELSATKGRTGDEIIEVEEDTPPQGPAVGLRLGSPLKSPPDTRKKVQRKEVSISVSETTLSPTGMEASEAEGASLRREADSLIDSHLAAHGLKPPSLEEVIPVESPREPGQAEREVETRISGEVEQCTVEEVPARETAEAKQARVARRWEEIRQEGQRLEAAGVLPSPPPPYKPYGLPEMWGEFLARHGEGLTAPGKAEVETSQRADEYLDQRIRSVSKTSLDGYMMLEADLRRKELREAGLESRLGTIEAEVRELRALVASQAATILELRQQLHGSRDGAESSRPGGQSQPRHGISEQPAVAEPQREAPMGRVILEPEEAKAKRKAERDAFEFRAPTELAVLPTMFADPAMPPSLEERLPSASDEPPQGSTGGSLDVLLEAVHSMQEDAGLFSPESKLEESLESEMGGAIEDIIAGRPQRLDTPDYEPVGARVQPGSSPRESEAGSEGPKDVPQCHELDEEARETPSPAGPQRKKKRPRKSFDSTCFYCTRGEHRALQCLKFLKDQADGKVSEKMYDRQGRVVERAVDGGRAQLYEQNQEEMSEKGLVHLNKSWIFL
ncbi:hypothetical protein CBR_g24045 [Chara braunii]|uniref:Reverse transcriptase/retrotransposon-derived protein RNase H-like domain-containing protein n=1 Tax=Chara braunii TaxID=69332 RepID=A0A388L5Q2_CHABU|nr:hypothetical protein CBR_g24045 [Chara braunii]|eukprot:GBG77598.1 hypothetical protein CBR_g24045 [Chara braunii]